MTHTIHDAIHLAKAFGRMVQEEFTCTEFRIVCERNKLHAYDGICATHDFCDANMLMLDAFVETFGREPGILTNADDENDAHLWNDAWAIAKAADFFA